MHKKIIILLVNRGAVEVDVILPLLYKLRDKYLIFTIFKNKKAYLSLKSINQLFSLWKETSKNYYIDSVNKSFFLKLAAKFVSILSSKNKFLDFLNQKIYKIKFFEDKLKYDDNQIKYIFTDYQVYNYWLSVLKKKYETSKVILFPNTPIISFSNIFLDNFFLKHCDYLLLTNQNDIKRFKNLDQRKKIKIITSGIMKFEKWWIRKLINKRSAITKIKNKKIITVAYNSRFDWLSKKDNKKHENQLEQIIKFFKSQNNFLYIFKIHPNVNSQNFFSLIKKYKFQNFIIRNDHLITLSKISTMMISHKNSAAALDSMALKCPVVELWNPGGKAYNSLNELKILKCSDNIDQFKKNFFDIIHNKNIKKFCNFKNFKSKYLLEEEKKLNTTKISNLLR